MIVTMDPLGELGHALHGEILTMSADEVKMRIPVEGNRQPFLLLHGGANAFLVEHAGSVLANLNAPDGFMAAGTELNVSHVRALTSGFATAQAHVAHVGRRSIHIDVKIFGDDAALSAIGHLTCVFTQQKN